MPWYAAIYVALYILLAIVSARDIQKRLQNTLLTIWGVTQTATMVFLMICYWSDDLRNAAEKYLPYLFAASIASVIVIHKIDMPETVRVMKAFEESSESVIIPWVIMTMAMLFLVPAYYWATCACLNL